jgi:hypothetical protein
MNEIKNKKVAIFLSPKNWREEDRGAISFSYDRLNENQYIEVRFVFSNAYMKEDYMDGKQMQFSVPRPPPANHYRNRHTNSNILLSFTHKNSVIVNAEIARLLWNHLLDTDWTIAQTEPVLVAVAPPKKEPVSASLGGDDEPETDDEFDLGMKKITQQAMTELMDMMYRASYNDFDKHNYALEA